MLRYAMLGHAMFCHVFAVFSGRTKCPGAHIRFSQFLVVGPEFFYLRSLMCAEIVSRELLVRPGGPTYNGLMYRDVLKTGILKTRIFSLIFF